MWAISWLLVRCFVISWLQDQHAVISCLQVLYDTRGSADCRYLRTSRGFQLTLGKQRQHFIVEYVAYQKVFDKKHMLIWVTVYYSYVKQKVLRNGQMCAKYIPLNVEKYDDNHMIFQAEIVCDLSIGKLIRSASAHSSLRMKKPSSPSSISFSNSFLLRMVIFQLLLASSTVLSDQVRYMVYVHSTLGPIFTTSGIFSTINVLVH